MLSWFIDIKSVMYKLGEEIKKIFKTFKEQ